MSTKAKVPEINTRDEMIGLLKAISIVSKRLALTLMELDKSSPTISKEEIFDPNAGL